MDEDKLLTTKEVAIRLSLSETEIRGMLSENVLPCIRVGRKGGRRRVLQSDLEAYIQQSKQNELNKHMPKSNLQSQNLRSFRPPAKPVQHRLSNLEALGFKK
jgi:excisionase family DNA binding protein